MTPFVANDDRAIGHWLRDRLAAQSDGPRPQRGHGRAVGAADGRGLMQHRYSQGEGRSADVQDQVFLRECLCCSRLCRHHCLNP